MLGDHFPRSVSPISEYDVSQTPRRSERRRSPICANDVEEGEEVLVKISDDNQSSGEAADAKPVTLPVKSSRDEVDARMLAHIPFRK